MPSVQVGDMKGIETNGLSTDPMEYANAITESANGKGMASMKKTGAMNAAIGKKVPSKYAKIKLKMIQPLLEQPKAMSKER